MNPWPFRVNQKKVPTWEARRAFYRGRGDGNLLESGQLNQARGSDLEVGLRSRGLVGIWPDPKRKEGLSSLCHLGFALPHSVVPVAVA